MRLLNIMTIFIGIVILLSVPAFADGTNYSVSGIVADVHGNPVKGANVTLIDINYNALASTQTNATGNYEFIGLLAKRPDAMVTVHVSYNDGNKTYDIPDNSTTWYLPSGHIIIDASQTRFPNYPETAESNVRSPTNTGTFSISGIVVDVQGNPVKGANVSLKTMEPTSTTSTTTYIVDSTLTNDSGYYYFTGTLPPMTTVTVLVSYNDGNKTYNIPPFFTRWYLAKGDQVINSSETRFSDYPPATKGFAYGVIYKDNRSLAWTNGDVYLISDDGKNQYHYHVNESDNGSFIFNVSPGSYEIYATHEQSGFLYTSPIQGIDVIPSWSTDYAYSVDNTVYNVPPTVIYLEPGSKQLIQPSPTTLANTTAVSAPDIPVKDAVVVTAGGVAAVSCAYVLIKFFGIGTVARAHSRLDKNRNRSELFKFIADNPGVTLHDIAHTMNMNLGTTRYHLFILGLNHRIVSSKFDDKFVRYFTNSGSYTKADQLIISMVRRDGVRNVLDLLLKEPGLTNADISDKLGIQVSATSRYIKELTEKGLVSRASRENGAMIYSIDGGVKENIVRLMGRVGGA